MDLPFYFNSTAEGNKTLFDGELCKWLAAFTRASSERCNEKMALEAQERGVTRFTRVTHTIARVLWRAYTAHGWVQMVYYNKKYMPQLRKQRPSLLAWLWPLWAILLKTVHTKIWRGWWMSSHQSLTEEIESFSLNVTENIFKWLMITRNYWQGKTVNQEFRAVLQPIYHELPWFMTNCTHLWTQTYLSYTTTSSFYEDVHFSTSVLNQRHFSRRNVNS